MAKPKLTRLEKAIKELKQAEEERKESAKTGLKCPDCGADLKIVLNPPHLEFIRHNG
jgi:ssDNA-binding Zn-finger/Zn-ribbon topoisomerase 1